MKWYQDERGNASAMRILVAVAVFSGVSIALIGSIAMFFQSASAGTAMSTGNGLALGALGMKGWQKSSESRGESK